MRSAGMRRSEGLQNQRGDERLTFAHKFSTNYWVWQTKGGKNVVATHNFI